MADIHRYRLFGLALESELELPELADQQMFADPDAEIVVRPVPPGFAASDLPRTDDDAAVFAVPGVAGYSVGKGRQIIVYPAEGADARNVRLYLLGSAMGLLLHQRGILPLHANAVEIDGQAFAFMGPSGAGKSTLAARFHDRGLRIVADDVCAVHFDAQSRPWVSEGLPRLRLWKSALEASGRQAACYQRSYAGDDEWDKFDVPLPRGSKAGGLLPLGAIYLLSRGSQFAIERLAGVAATDAIFANTYRGQHIEGAVQARNHWESTLKLISATSIFHASREWGFDRLDDQARRLIDHATRLASPTLREAG